MSLKYGVFNAKTGHILKHSGGWVIGVGRVRGWPTRRRAERKRLSLVGVVESYVGFVCPDCEGKGCELCDGTGEGY